MTDNLKEREAFETWFRENYHERLDRNMPDKSYNSPAAFSTWKAWQARAAIDAALAARGAVPAGLPEIDYEALIKAAYARDKKWAQGTNGCIAFKHGAEWFRDQVAAAHQQVAQAKPEQAVQLPSIDEIAQFIRTADGAHQMGAGALAECLHEWLTEEVGVR